MAIDPPDRHESEAFVRRYIAALAEGEIGGNEDLWYTPDILATEWPTSLDPRGVVRDIHALQYFHRRQPAPRRELFIEEVLTDGHNAAVRLSERLNNNSKTMPGNVAIASGAAFFRLRAGRICKQQTYWCIPPSWTQGDASLS